MKRNQQSQLSAGGGAFTREVLFDPLSPALSHEGRGSELFYQHDAIGNVWLVLEQDGVDMELFCEFSQDAYGNPLAADGFTGTDWTTARADGITEHQTGKWIDPFSGLHFFHARWYDSETGRFVSRDWWFSLDFKTGCGSGPKAFCVRPRLRSSNLERMIPVVYPEYWNQYLFCLNNPHSYYDNNGELAKLLNLDSFWDVAMRLRQLLDWAKQCTQPIEKATEAVDFSCKKEECQRCAEEGAEHRKMEKLFATDFTMRYLEEYQKARDFRNERYKKCFKICAAVGKDLVRMITNIVTGTP